MNDAYRPDWYYDDLRQVGTDFENAETVAAYDRNQGTNDAEDEALLDGPPADLVTTKYALHHLPDFRKAAALVRINRMLRPVGRLFLRDVVFSFEARGLSMETSFSRRAEKPTFAEGLTLSLSKGEAATLSTGRSPYALPSRMTSFTLPASCFRLKGLGRKWMSAFSSSLRRKESSA
jgi:hypothetical protein